MKQFFKYVLATIVGIVISSIVIFLMFLGIVGAIVSSADKKEVKIEPNSILYVDLKQEIVDRGSEDPFKGFDFASFQPNSPIGLNQILKAIANAKEDSNIKGILLELDAVNAGAATTEEIRNALIDFKSSGKFIYAYSDTYSQKAYYLASVADSVFLNPEGMIEWLGLRSEIMFFKKTLEKLGVEPQILRHGKFKSAVEPFMLDKMSPENREQTLTYVSSIWNQWVKGISETRGISADKLNSLANNMEIFNAKKALENKLVDGLIYKDELIATLKTKLGIEEKKDISSIELKKYFKAPEVAKRKFSKDKIAVIYASGEIGMGEGGDDNIGSEGLSRTIRKARRDSSIKAIVFRINSPGGSALASEVIWREVDLAAKVKPVIVSMGDVAASGGYYIAAPATTIMANPTTITGSIGVFGLFFNLQKALDNKLGITVDVVKTNDHADFFSVFRPMTAEEKAVGQMFIEQTYQTFIGHVSAGRGIPVEQVDAIGQGRVWSGVNAKDIKLVDEFGGLTDAIKLAAEKAGLENYRLVELPKQKKLFEQLMEDMSAEAKAWMLKDELGLSFKAYNRIKSMLNNQGVQARMPYDIEVY
ncbi:MAG: signal peptide peptidase SppA [Tenuifilum sp.]|uniref:signal peptide peptidase SppA n=1 Tax=Tenuifilum sp. TaxID=2760880 RepID=UPI001B4B8EBD|nr:signal peptide peptidase SppA [Bacteroidales bacterium]MBP9028242.1 signal peptide peptidase SppA [Bacteroidales bacterium]HOK60536.1 signal peptide peptidase SppA [Tenuifilum sp.]HQE55627.1 signal peptide peptidase SppA [Tenuifilum sp.]HRR12535.1 signal peptide peptidase SppA [Tenuifilum sp.]